MTWCFAPVRSDSPGFLGLGSIGNSLVHALTKSREPIKAHESASGPVTWPVLLQPRALGNLD